MFSSAGSSSAEPVDRVAAIGWPRRISGTTQATCRATSHSFQFGNSSFGDALTFLGNFTGQTATFHISVDGDVERHAPGFNGSDFQFMVLPAGTIDANADNTLNIFNNPGNIAIANNTYPPRPTTIARSRSTSP